MVKRGVMAPAPAPVWPVAMSVDTIFRSVWESAVESLVKGILVLAFGSIAIGLVSGIWKQMAPSPPPGVVEKPELEESPFSSTWGAALREHRFLVVFGVIFGLTLCGRLARARRAGDPSQAATRLEKMGKKLRDGWFDLIVVNAFGAMIAATIVIWAQRFSVVYWALDLLADEAQSVARSLFGPAGANGLGAWLGWYGENRLRFAFWCFYLAAICDDLGIANLKTFGRWLARRARHGAARTLAAPSD